MTPTKHTRVMYLSWEIQRKRKLTRSKSLKDAWSITQNEAITIYYLVKKHSHNNYPNKVVPSSLSLFK
jgi:hypothetical protein